MFTILTLSINRYTSSASLPRCSLTAADAILARSVRLFSNPWPLSFALVSSISISPEVADTDTTNWPPSPCCAGSGTMTDKGRLAESLSAMRGGFIGSIVRRGLTSSGVSMVRARMLACVRVADVSRDLALSAVGF